VNNKALLESPKRIQDREEQEMATAAVATEEMEISFKEVSRKVSYLPLKWRP
jgi:hypothetical protein